MATGDRRDDQTWVVLELAKSGEAAIEDGTLCARLLSELGVDDDWPLFIPAMSYERKGRRTTLHLMEGYVFVGSGLPDTRYFAMEHRSTLVRQVLSMPSGSGIRALATIPEAEVNGMRAQLREQIATDITEGMTVTVVEGVYSPLQGRVLTVGENEADVLIELRSIRIIKSLPRVFLEPVE
jgi:transcription antitermination factor NusG